MSHRLSTDLPGSWTLLVRDGYMAEADLSGADPERVRIGVTEVSDGPAWGIQLQKRGFTVTGGRRHVLRFLARADRSRRLTVSVAGALEPWPGLGLFRQVEVTRELRAYEVDFMADTDAVGVHVHFDLGRSAVSAELGDVTLAALPPAEAYAPRRAYLLCATPRCGSNLLAGTLGQHGGAGKPQEYFLYWYALEHEPGQLDPEMAKAWQVPVDVYLRKAFDLGTTYNGVFGAKLMWSYVDDVVRQLRTRPGCERLDVAGVLHAALPDLTYLHIRREDRVRQAVSLVRAMQSGEWFKGQRAGAPEGDDTRIAFATGPQADRLHYDFDQIAESYAMLQAHDTAWRGFFRAAGVHAHEVTYEQLVADPEGTVSGVLDHIGVLRPHLVDAPRAAARRQADALNEEWSERFSADLATRGGAEAVLAGSAATPPTS